MSFVKEFRAWFFRGNAPINPLVPGDHKDNLSTEGVPSQDTMERLTASHLSFKETSDRAKQFTGAELDEDLVGHSQAETDANAKANVDGLQATTTKVVHAGQLPTVGIGPNQAITGTQVPLASSALLDTSADGTATRNNFLVTITAALLGWYQDVSDKIDFLFTNTGGLTYKEVPTGDWNMNTTVGITVAHGLSATEWKTIKEPGIVIRDDDDQLYYTAKSDELFIDEISSTLIAAQRLTAGFFDSLDFDSTSYNRGTITFHYLKD